MPQFVPLPLRVECHPQTSQRSPSQTSKREGRHIVPIAFLNVTAVQPQFRSNIHPSPPNRPFHSSLLAAIPSIQGLNAWSLKVHRPSFPGCEPSGRTLGPLCSREIVQTCSNKTVEYSCYRFLQQKIWLSTLMAWNRAGFLFISKLTAAAAVQPALTMDLNAGILHSLISLAHKQISLRRQWIQYF